MRYLKPEISTININNNIYNLIFSLEVIDNLQDKVQLPMTEIIMMLTDEKSLKSRKLTAQVLLKYLTEQLVDIDDDKLDYYSALLLNTYIEQIKSKEIEGIKKASQNDGYEFINIEHWVYIGTVVLQKPEDEVWKMTLGKLMTMHNEHAKYSGWIKEEKEVSIDEAIPI